MHVTSPKVFVIAETRINYDGLDKMLAAIGATNWNKPSSTPPELLVEVAGRMCYKSFEVGLNPNVTKIREGNKEYIGNILKQRHGSVLQHATTTIAFIDVSRVFTHELVRHVAGTAVSQESMRYVRMEDIGVYIPECIYEEGGEVLATFTDAVLSAEKSYAKLVELTLKDDNTPFHKKKTLTSALRRIAPGGHSTNIIMTANHRAWRHMIELRTEKAGDPTKFTVEEEIRLAFVEVGRIFSAMYPAFYQDMHAVTHTDSGEIVGWAFNNSKV